MVPLDKNGCLDLGAISLLPPPTASAVTAAAAGGSCRCCGGGRRTQLVTVIDLHVPLDKMQG